MKDSRIQLLHELVSSAAAIAPDRLAIVSPDGTTATFAGFDHQIRCVSSWIGERTQIGDRVAVVAGNSIGYAQLYYGVPRAGRILALINQRLTPAEQITQLATTKPTILLGDQHYLTELRDVAAQVPSIRDVVTFQSPQWHTATTREPADPIDSPAPDDPAWLLFTSGSTGAPKGVVHSHRSVLAAVWGTVSGRSIPAGGVYLLPFPMCHIAGYNMLVHHATGSTVVLADHFRPAAFTEAVNTYGVTSCSLAPTMLHSLLGHLDQTGIDLPTLRAIAYGSAAIPADLLRRAVERLDVDFHQGYGMTETGGNVTFLGPDQHRAGITADPAILASAGRPHADAEIRIAGAEAVGEIGEIGEILVRGDQVTIGYWPGLAAAAVDGWFATGDVGRLDADGTLTVVDRVKDVIVTGGENVSSREVEDTLSTHPGVEMAAVVSVPDVYWGEAVCAVVVPAPDTQPTAEQLIDHVRTRIAAFKRPRHVLFVDRLPMTSNGKVAKDAVRSYARDAVG